MKNLLATLILAITTLSVTAQNKRLSQLREFQEDFSGSQNIESVDDETSNAKERETESKFINIEAGLSQSGLRDFSTSPLIYKGMTAYFSLARFKTSNLREIEYGFCFFTGNYTAKFNEHSATSLTTSVDLYYSRLHQLKRWYSEKWNFKAGGMLLATGNIRTNYDLQNNGRGIESFHSLLGSFKTYLDISRKETKHKKFLFIKYTQHPVKQELSFRLNIGLINSYFRNGFIYANQSDIVTNDSSLEDYQFHLFKGQMYNTALDYTKYFTNHNAIRFSYKWNAYTTNETYNDFEMVHHIFSFAFLFNTNNK